MASVEDICTDVTGCCVLVPFRELCLDGVIDPEKPPTLSGSLTINNPSGLDLCDANGAFYFTCPTVQKFQSPILNTSNIGLPNIPIVGWEIVNIEGCDYWALKTCPLPANKDSNHLTASCDTALQITTGRPLPTVPWALETADGPLVSGATFPEFSANLAAAGYQEFILGEIHYICPCPPEAVDQPQGTVFVTANGETVVKSECIPNPDPNYDPNAAAAPNQALDVPGTSYTLEIQVASKKLKFDFCIDAAVDYDEIDGCVPIKNLSIIPTEPPTDITDPFVDVLCKTLNLFEEGELTDTTHLIGVDGDECHKYKLPAICEQLKDLPDAENVFPFDGSVSLVGVTEDGECNLYQLDACEILKSLATEDPTLADSSQTLCITYDSAGAPSSCDLVTPENHCTPEDRKALADALAANL